MIALILAAQVAIAVPPSRTFVVRPENDCDLWEVTPVRRQGHLGPSSKQRLGELPKANLELTVLRRDPDGCSVPVIVRDGAEGDGRTAKPGR